MRSRFVSPLLTGILSMIFLGTSVRAQTVWRVDDDAPLGGSGESWSGAFRFLRDALIIAAAGDEIHVAGGTYLPDHSLAHPEGTGSPGSYFSLKNEVAIRGGYAGLADPNDPDRRDFTAFESVLSGDLNGDDGPDFENYGDNCDHVLLVWSSGFNETAVLDGFTIRGGTGKIWVIYRGGGGLLLEGGNPTFMQCNFEWNCADETSFPDFEGGGAILCLNGAYPLFLNCTIANNRTSGSGGGVCCIGSSPRFEGCTIADNRSTHISNFHGGGGVVCSDGGVPEFEDCVISGNYARGGGGFCSYQSELSLVACRIEDNISPGFGGGLRIFYGGLTARGCELRGNLARSTGGRGGAVSYDHPFVIEFEDCLFESNRAMRNENDQECLGGAVEGVAGDSDISFTRCSFRENVARIGGAIYLDGGAPVFQQCSFVDNLATSISYYAGSGAVTSESDAVFLDCAFQGNTGSMGGAVASGGGELFINCAFIDNTANQPTWRIDGGAMYVWGWPMVIDCVFAGNRVEGPSNENPPRWPDGGAVLIELGAPLFLNNTVVDNDSVGECGGISCYSNLSGGTIVNSILWNNSGRQAAGDLEISHSVVQDGWAWGETNQTTDPGLAFEDDWHLTLGSICIDAGVSDLPVELPDYDLEGNARVLNGDQNPAAAVDIGALEYDPAQAALAFSPHRVEMNLPVDGYGVGVLFVRNSGGAGTFLNWEITTDCPWMIPWPSSGRCEGEIDTVYLIISTAGLEPGLHECEVTLTGQPSRVDVYEIPISLRVFHEIRVPVDYVTIQDAIFATADHDVVVVADGVWTGDGNQNLDFCGRKITVRSEHGPEYCTIDCGGSGFGFRFQSEEDQTSVVDGFTITHAAEPAILCLESQATIENCILVDNAQQGVYCMDGSMTLRRCQIRHNGDGQYGGVYCRGGLDLEDCKISDHTASSGAGITCTGGGITLERCTLFDNHADTDGGAIYCFYSYLNIEDSVIRNNTAGDRGGGICVDSGDPSLQAVSVVENEASSGGGIYVTYRDFAISSTGFWNCVIVHNIASIDGGGVSFGGASIPFSNCTITRNVASLRGGGVYANNAAPLANCTVVHNLANDGGGLWCATGAADWTNCILWENNPNEFTMNAATITINYCDVLGGWEGEGNIDIDPRLTQDGTHLRNDSPCIDAGIPQDDDLIYPDTDGEWRIQDDSIDIGSDEFQDTDLDGIPDWWETANSGSATQMNAEADPDQDESNNLREYWRSSDPYRPPAVFYVDTAGQDDWDGRAAVWDGQHGPKATIQAAIEPCDLYEGDWIIVAPGTYSGTLGTNMVDFLGKTVRVRSVDPENPAVVASTILDCQGGPSTHHRAFCLGRWEGESSRVEGLTVRNGYAQDGGAIRIKKGSSLTISNCRLINNYAMSDGGAIHCDHGALRLLKSVMSENRAVQRGGVLFTLESDAIVSHCTIAENQAWLGGAVYTEGGILDLSNALCTGNYGSSGGVAFVTSGKAFFNQCTVVGNSTDNDGVLYLNPASSIVNCVVWDNISMGVSGQPAVLYSDIQGGYAGEGNLSANPRFADADGIDDDPATWDDNDFRLLAGSPCIDAGDNNSISGDVFDLDRDGDTEELLPIDLGDMPRFQEDAGMVDVGNVGMSGLPVVDIGAYEYQGQTCRGDLDGDGLIDLGDLAQLLGHYGAASGAVYADGDLGRDGDVDLDDLAELLSLYGHPCP